MNCHPLPVVGTKPDAEGKIYTRCLHCGYVSGPHFPLEIPVRVCTASEAIRVPPPIKSKIYSIFQYAQAWARHRAKGRPVLQFPQILERFRICSTCTRYNDVEGACAKCTCYVNLSQHGILPNKLEWADEVCPDHPPKWQAIEITPKQE